MCEIDSKELVDIWVTALRLMGYLREMCAEFDSCSGCPLFSACGCLIDQEEIDG